MKPTRAVLILATVLFFWFLWGHDLWAPDEPFFGEGAREMVVDGEWLVPHVNGIVNDHKPPLFFWLIALLSLPFGQVFELTARLPSALAALGTLALTMRLGRRWYGERTAALAGVILATSYLFWDKARWSQIDALLCLLVWLALCAFEAYRSDDADGRRSGILFWAASALAVLAKGPIGLILPLAIALIILAVDRQLGRWRGFAPLLGPLAFLAITGAWVLLVTVAGPDEYSVWGALREHFLERGVRGMHHVQPFWYYAERLPIALLPWTGLLPGALLLGWRRRADPGGRMALVAAVFVVVFFSISTEKRDLYVLPALPAIALMMAELVATACEWRDGAAGTIHRRWATAGMAAGGGLFVLLGLAMPVLGLRFELIPSWMVLGLAVIVLSQGTATLYLALRGRPLQSVLAMAAGMASAYLVVTALIMPRMDATKSGREFALRIKEATAASRAAGERVLAFDLANLPNAFAFYSDGVYTVETAETRVLAAHLAEDARVWAVVNGDTAPAEILDRVELVDRARLSRREVLLVANRPPPESE